MSLLTSIDNIGKLFGRIKTIALIIIVVLFGLSALRSGCQRDQINELIRRVSGLDVENDLLYKRMMEKQEKVYQIELERDSLKTVEEELIAKLEDIKEENRKFRESMSDIPADILETPADSSYKFINQVAYPFGGKKEFPLSEPQIKGIHLTYLEHIYLDSINSNLRDEVNALYARIGLKEGIEDSYSKETAVLRSMNKNLQKMHENSEEKVKLYQENCQNSEFWRKFWRTTTLISAGVAGGLIIFK